MLNVLALPLLWSAGRAELALQGKVLPVVSVRPQGRHHPVSKQEREKNGRDAQIQIRAWKSTSLPLTESKCRD